MSNSGNMNDFTKSFEEILQEYWNEADGEITFDKIIEAHQEFLAQFDEDENEIMGTVEDPFEYE